MNLTNGLVTKANRETGVAAGVLTPEELLVLQAQLWELLRLQAARLTSGESSSIPAETAERLLSSLSYTFGVNLRENSPALRPLLHTDLEEELRRGQLRLQETLRGVRGLWQAACVSLPEVKNRSLHTTLQSIGGFWDRYQPRFFAQDIPCDIDYQLCHPVPETLLGVDFVGEYLRRIALESSFLRRFKSNLVRLLLKNYCPDYYGMLINLYEPVAVNVIGRMLADRQADGLEVAAADLTIIQKRLDSLTGPACRAVLKKAAAQAGRQLGLWKEGEKAYLEQTALALYPRLKAALNRGSLDGVFLSFHPGGDWVKEQFR